MEIYTRTINLMQLIACIKREINMRRQVYPKQIATRKMTQGQADWEILCMEEIQALLEKLQAEELTK